jgi:O-antigen ligase
VLLLLLLDLAARLMALGAGRSPSAALSCAAVVLAAASCLARPAWFGPALFALGGALFLFGFHSYNPRSQLFELALAALAVVLVLRLLLNPRGPLPSAFVGILPFAVLYGLCATFSLALLPPRVLEHRVFLEGTGLARALFGAFPKDPLYPIASVERLWLFLAFAALLAAQPDGAALYRRLARGIVLSVAAAVVLGLLDFAGVLPLARYNMSQIFFGAGYRRLQSTFGNPSWYACFVACSLPFVLLEWSEARRSTRAALALLLPLAAASLFLSGARASWLAGLLLLFALAGLRLAAGRAGRPLAAPGALARAAVAASLAAFALLAAVTYWPSNAVSPPSGSRESPDRLDGLAHELRIRGLGVSSPRRVAAEYAFALAKQRPLLGLGYESFNMHLRTQLAQPGSPVARVINTAVAADPTETVFDDSHDTYLQVLVGTGALGLALWLGLAAAALALVAASFLREPGPLSLSLALGMLLFHFYGLFQGMAYLPVLFFLFFVELGYAMALDGGPLAGWLSLARRHALPVLVPLVVVALPLQVLDGGYRSLKRALGVETYLPDEAAEFEGFYSPEIGPSGEFRWMARRGIVNVARAAPFRLWFACEHPDLEREPVVVSLRFDGEGAESIVCRRPGTQEKRFDPPMPGALRLSVSRTFTPGGADRRELGVAVSAIRWE